VSDIHHQQSVSSGLRVYNTLTRSIETFTPIQPGKVRMYVCGVTVYDDAHIGHGMSAIIFDVIRRYLLHSGYDVEFARNFTDIDDKIIFRANAEGIAPDVLTDRLISEWMHQIEQLNILPATITPRATDEIPEITRMISGLIEHGNAYESQGDVYFRVRSFAGYGKLSHRKIDDLMSGARIEVNESKDDPLDFALWKKAKPREPMWTSPWSDGRPGWHIECSAMCTHHLGGVIDIHGGGSDLIFPHHENEIAQSEAFLGQEPYARYWLHNGMLRLDGEKMSKSIGNVVPLATILERGMAAAFRLMVLQSHYRAPVNYTEGSLQAAENGLSRLRSAIIAPSSGADIDSGLESQMEASNRAFHESMANDFDTPSAVAAIFDLGRAINRVAASGSGGASVESAQNLLQELANVLGLVLVDIQPPDRQADPFIDVLLDVRKRLRDARQFQLADNIRDQLAGLGVTLEDTASGTTWKISR